MATPGGTLLPTKWTQDTPATGGQRHTWQTSAPRTHFWAPSGSKTLMAIEWTQDTYGHRADPGHLWPPSGPGTLMATEWA